MRRHGATLSPEPSTVKAGPHTRCANCGKRRPKPKTFSYVSKTDWEHDPYCSTACCREAHGIVEAAGGYGLDYGATDRKSAA